MCRTKTLSQLPLGTKEENSCILGQISQKEASNIEIWLLHNTSQTTSFMVSQSYCKWCDKIRWVGWEMNSFFLPWKIFFTEDLAITGVALIAETVLTVQASQALRMPWLVKNLKDKPIHNRKVASSTIRDIAYRTRRRKDIYHVTQYLKVHKSWERTIKSSQWADLMWWN